MMYRKYQIKNDSHYLRNTFVILLYFLVSLISLREIIFSQGIITLQSEWSIPLFPGQLKQLFLDDLFSWKTYIDFGFYSDFPTGMYYKFILYLFGFFGLNGEIATKILVLFVMTSAGFFTYFFCRKLKLSHLSSVISGLFYMLTPYVFDRLSIGHVYLLLDYSLIPLILAFFLEYMKRGKIVSLIIIITLFLFSSYIESQILIFISMFFMTIFYSRSLNNFFKIFRGIVIVFFVFIFLKGHWVAILNEIQFNSINLRFGDVPITLISNLGFPLKDTIRLLGFGLNYFNETATSWKIWIILSFLLPLIVFSTLIFAPYDKRTIIFIILSLIGITLASGIYSILGDTWPFLLEVVPYLRIFRDINKPIPLVCLSYAVLLGLFHHKMKKIIYLKFFGENNFCRKVLINISLWLVLILVIFFF